MGYKPDETQIEKAINNLESTPLLSSGENKLIIGKYVDRIKECKYTQLEWQNYGGLSKDVYSRRLSNNFDFEYMHKRTSFIIALAFAETPEEVFEFMFWTGHVLKLSKEEERVWVHIAEVVVNNNIIGLDRVEAADRFLIQNKLKPLL